MDKRSLYKSHDIRKTLNWSKTKMLNNILGREEILIIRVNKKNMEMPNTPYKIILIKLNDVYRSIKSTLEVKVTISK